MKGELRIRLLPCGELRAAAWIVICGAIVLFALPPESGAQKSPKRIAIPAPADVATPPEGAQKSTSGIAMKVLTPGRGSAHPMENDCVRVRFTGWRKDGSVFSTSGLHGESDVQCLSAIMPGLTEALKTMAVGEKRRIWVPASLTFIPQKKPEETPAGDLTFDVELDQIVRAPPTPRDLKAPPKKAVRTPSGLALLVLKKGSGKQHPSLTSQVTLHVSGWTSDGKLFQSTLRGGQPAVFLVADTPPAWREALAQMVVGEKVRLWAATSEVYEIELLALR